MDFASLYGLVDPEIKERLAPMAGGVGRAVVMGQGELDDGRKRYLVMMVIATDEDLGELATYAGRVELEKSTRKDRPDLQGYGAGGIIKSPVWQTD